MEPSTIPTKAKAVTKPANMAMMGIIGMVSAKSIAPWFWWRRGRGVLLLEEQVPHVT